MHPYRHFQHYNYMRERRRERELRYLLAEQRTVHLAAAWKRVFGRLRALFEKPAAGIRQQPHAPYPLEAPAPSEERPGLNGFTAEEIATFHRLRRWYQLCNHEHTAMLRHWEFLRMLVNSGRLEV